MTADPRPNVITALAGVLADVGGIAKMSPEQRRKAGLGGGDERGITYAYRGIDQIAAAVQPLLGRHGVAIVPTEILHYVVDDLTINSKPWTDTTIRQRWTIYGPGGIDDCIIAESIGVGRDNSDKGANKASTGAYKNLLLRLFSIGDPADDTDGHTHEADARPTTPPPAEVDPAQTDAARAVFAHLRDVAPHEPAQAAAAKALAAAEGRKLTVADLEDPEYRARVVAAMEAVAEHEAASAANLGDPPDDDDPLDRPLPEGNIVVDGNGAPVDLDTEVPA